MVSTKFASTKLFSQAFFHSASFSLVVLEKQLYFPSKTGKEFKSSCKAAQQKISLLTQPHVRLRDFQSFLNVAISKQAALHKAGSIETFSTVQ